VCQLAKHVKDSPKQFSDRHTRVERSKHGVRLQLYPPNGTVELGAPASAALTS